MVVVAGCSGTSELSPFATAAEDGTGPFGCEGDLSPALGWIVVRGDDVFFAGALAPSEPPQFPSTERIYGFDLSWVTLSEGRAFGDDIERYASVRLCVEVKDDGLYVPTYDR